MKNFDLTPEEYEELRAALKSAKCGKNPKEAYKINALILLGSGWTLSEVSDALFLDEESLRQYAKVYREKGLHGVLQTFYKGSEAKLTLAQQARLTEELDARIFLTTLEVCAFVDSEFGVKYSISGMNDLLHRLGYVYKKPKLKPANADRDRQEAFLECYFDFMANKSEHKVLFFMDAVHPVHNSMPAYGWVKKGEDRELPANSGRQRLNIHGAMNAETFEIIPLISEESVNTDSTVELLGQLETLYPLATKIYVILDNAKYHYSKVVKSWLDDHPRIQLVFIPPYSPELNLIERLWKVFKKNVMYNQYYETFKEFQSACIGFFRNQNHYRDEIVSIMGEGLEALA